MGTMFVIREGKTPVEPGQNNGCGGTLPSLLRQSPCRSKLGRHHLFACHVTRAEPVYHGQSSFVLMYNGGSVVFLAFA